MGFLDTLGSIFGFVNQGVNLYTGIGQYKLNKDYSEFNKDLANRQQSLSEQSFALSKDSYEHGIENTAEQYRNIGINPASVMSGNASYTTSFNGGSNVNSGNGATNLDSSLLSAVLSAKMQKENIEAQKVMNAKDNETSLEVAKINNQNADVQRNLILSQTDYQTLVNSVQSEAEDYLRSIGFNSAILNSFKNMDTVTASFLGATKLFKGLNNYFSSFSSDSDVKSTVKTVHDGQTLDEALESVGSVPASDVKKSTEEFLSFSSAVQTGITEFGKIHSDFVFSDLPVEVKSKLRKCTTSYNAQKVLNDWYSSR